MEGSARDLKFRVSATTRQFRTQRSSLSKASTSPLVGPLTWITHRAGRLHPLQMAAVGVQWTVKVLEDAMSLPFALSLTGVDEPVRGGRKEDTAQHRTHVTLAGEPGVLAGGVEAAVVAAAVEVGVLAAEPPIIMALVFAVWILWSLFTPAAVYQKLSLTFLYAGGLVAMGFLYGTVTGVLAPVMNLPPFFFANSSGWILGNTPPDAMVT
ncbi:hypothetical protein E2C01_021220 [Portunus trituberculatus]|uniref:Uncharacterized protein n=1 Tax=Portunus trituberculatus TaxID=210409 RepID=A0A5B7E3V1_PORTR|nr:hypothetical protein [Portunus trituberculatus]